MCCANRDGPRAAGGAGGGANSGGVATARAPHWCSAWVNRSGVEATAAEAAGGAVATLGGGGDGPTAGIVAGTAFAAGGVLLRWNPWDPRGAHVRGQFRQGVPTLGGFAAQVW